MTLVPKDIDPFTMHNSHFIQLVHRIQQPIPKLENSEILQIVVDLESKRIVMVIWVVEFPREGYKIDRSSLFDINRYHELQVQVF